MVFSSNRAFDPAVISREKTLTRSSGCPCFTNKVGRAEAHPSELLATQPSDLLAQPIGFIGETVRAIDSFQRLVALEHVEANAPLQLAQTDRAEMQRAAVTFGQMI